MLKKHKQALLLAVVVVGAGLVLAKRKKEHVPMAGEGMGMSSFLSEIDSWTGASGRNKKAARKEFLSSALPASVTAEDYEKFITGAPLGGGYTEQDRMLLSDTFG